MCATCGCGDETASRITLFAEPGGRRHEHGNQPHQHDGQLHQHDLQAHHHDLEPHHHDGAGNPHSHGATEALHDGAESGRTVILEQQILAKNDLLAERNRDWLHKAGVFAVNLMSSPGAGKTTLLEQTIAGLPGPDPIAVIEGDQETPLDAERIRASGRPVIQINTGAGCHLDADMVRRALMSLNPEPGTLLFIENVGNLVCPALFDLGEAKRVVLASVTEGADKPRKYPHMYRTADLVLVNKMDLLPYVKFDVDRFSNDLRQINPSARLLFVTATAAEGLTSWFEWLASASPLRTSVAP